MKDQDKTKEELINELASTRQKIAELEDSMDTFKRQRQAAPDLGMVTNRKTAEEALAESEERLQLALRGADLGLWDYNLQTGEAVVSQRRAEMVGYSVDELEPHISSWGSMVHPDDLPRVVEAFNAHEKGETPIYECEHRLRHKSGEYIWVLARAKIMERDAAGSPVRLIGTSLDVTDRKRVEEALSKARVELERRVEERTAELNELNTDLLREIAERKKTEEELRESEQRFRNIFEQGSLGIAIVGLDYRWVAVNGRLSEIVGYTEDELTKLTFVDITHPEDAEADVDYAVKLVRGETRFYRTEKRYIKKNGDVIWINLTASLIRDEQGKPLYFLSMIEDITDRKHTEQAMRESEERYRSLVENVGVGISLIDSDHNVVMANTTLGKWHHKPASEFSGKKCFQVFRKRESACPSCPGIEAMTSGQATEVEGEGKRDDGTRINVLIRAFPTFGPDGAVTGFIEVVEDLTERKRAQEALKESEGRYRSLFEESRDGVYSVLRDGEITDANASFTEIFGYTREEIIGKDIRELYADPSDRPKFQEEIEKQGFTKDYELKFRKKDGTEVECLVTSSVQLGHDGSIIGYRGLMRDLTIRKKLQRQLFQAQKMEAVGTLASGVAHDFNNLLTVIMGSSELLLMAKGERDRSYKKLQMINQAARHGADLTQRLLAFSRRAEAKPRPLNLNHHVRELREMLARTIPKMIEIEAKLADDLSPVNADPTQVDQILMNLAVNARDAMPETGRLAFATNNVFLDEEYARTHLGAKPGAYVLLTVSDSGHGIDRETLVHIFEPFYTTKEVGKGTGLGLAMVYGIVKQHGGYISCYSEPGQGTTFKVYLPAIVAGRPESENPGREVQPKGGPETILLVDDEPLVREVGKGILENSGYTVVTAADGKEAVELFKRNRKTISLVILDLIMPEMDGNKCLEELLKIDSKARILISSGFAASGRTKDVLERGLRGFIGKPYDVKEMLQAVREILDQG